MIPGSEFLTEDMVREMRDWNFEIWKKGEYLLYRYRRERERKEEFDLNFLSWVFERI